MPKLFFLLLLVSFCSCKLSNTNPTNEPNKELSALFENYWAERMQLIPIESTQNSDTTNNDKLYADFTDSYRAKLKDFFGRFLTLVKKYDRENLDAADQVSYDIFTREMQLNIDAIGLGYFGNTVLYPDHQYMPFSQFEGIPISLGQLGSGDGSQPFKTARDYNNWLARAAAFPAWADSAIVYFRKGMAANIVLPASLVTKMIPQMDAMVVSDISTSLFYGRSEERRVGKECRSWWLRYH